ncbi:PIN domain-containing protein [Neolewinella lacunae]|uniref:PIN domain-containing protein n=1 Tax=Neolewinella lacunae TaxID=1517758 RepID=A0A923PSJ5_9BACT|nr:PIN domain-containing protein [Neolewinella lacunae]MBC6996709.1 hypothetical protein [Neolewinella lacunae]MDN3633426.1 PIN domain-containing protein [Neolewinella lacunae]
MTVYIVDTNIIFSALLKPEGSISQFVFNRQKYDIRLIAPLYLQLEMDQHFTRIVELTKVASTAVRTGLNLLYREVEFISDDLIPIPHYARAANLVHDIDDRDLNFVALSSYKDEYLLTGDLKLYDGLVSKGYFKVITFQELKEKHNIL